MNAPLQALLQASWPVHLHLALCLMAAPLGLLILLRRKGTPAHRFSGRVWAALMLATALLSFAIQGDDRLSWIHGLSVVTLVSMPAGVWLARRGHIRAHRLTMGANLAGLLVAGAFTLLPHRLLGQWVFGAG